MRLLKVFAALPGFQALFGGGQLSPGSVTVHHIITQQCSVVPPQLVSTKTVTVGSKFGH
jgi:hypothetical protein